MINGLQKFGWIHAARNSPFDHHNCPHSSVPDDPIFRRWSDLIRLRYRDQIRISHGSTHNLVERNTAPFPHRSSPYLPIPPEYFPLLLPQIARFLLALGQLWLHLRQIFLRHPLRILQLSFQLDNLQKLNISHIPRLALSIIIMNLLIYHFRIFLNFSVWANCFLVPPIISTLWLFLKYLFK